MVTLEPRKWKPLSKEETGLSLYLDHKLNKKGIEGISTFIKLLINIFKKFLLFDIS